MKFGFIPIEGGACFAEMREEVLLGERLGFDSVWLEEHHGVRTHYWPSPLVALAGIAACTERIVLGSDIIVLPLYHPVRVAEDVAMLDVMTGGRFVLGAAIGYRPDEFGLYGVPLKNRGRRFDEALRLIRELWTHEQVTFDGEYYRLEGQSIEPRPVTRPCPPIWVGGWGPRALERAARLGESWIPGPTAGLEVLLEARLAYRANLQALGIDPASRPTPLTRDMVIAETDEEARQMAEKHLLAVYRDEYGGGQWQHPLIGHRDHAPLDQFGELSRDRFLVGSPETIVSQIQHFVEAFGVDHLICRLFFPGISHAFLLSELRLLAGEVMPAFRTTRTSGP